MAKPFYEQGAYIAEITEQALGKTKNGHPQFVLGIRILGRPDPKDPSTYQAIQSYDRAIYRVITDKTIDYVMEDLEILGFNRGHFGALDPTNPQHQSFVGQQIDVWCKHELDLEQMPREKWQISRKSSGLQVEALDAKSSRELDALFGKHLKKLKPPEATSPKPALKPVASRNSDLEISDDDIPF